MVALDDRPMLRPWLPTPVRPQRQRRGRHRARPRWRRELHAWLGACRAARRGDVRWGRVLLGGVLVAALMMAWMAAGVWELLTGSGAGAESRVDSPPVSSSAPPAPSPAEIRRAAAPVLSAPIVTTGAAVRALAWHAPARAAAGAREVAARPARHRGHRHGVRRPVARAVPQRVHRAVRGVVPHRVIRHRVIRHPVTAARTVVQATARPVVQPVVQPVMPAAPKAAPKLAPAPKPAAAPVLRPVALVRPAPVAAAPAAPISLRCGAAALAGTRPGVSAAGRLLMARFGIAESNVLGRAGRAGASDHPAGLALDFMVRANVPLGNTLADYVLAHRAELGVSYVIWRQRINLGHGWTAMPDRGSPTANHMDHVHVSFTGTGGGC